MTWIMQGHAQAQIIGAGIAALPEASAMARLGAGAATRSQ